MKHKLIMENWRKFQESEKQINEAPPEYFGADGTDPMAAFALSAQGKFKDGDVEGGLKDLEMYKTGSEAQGEFASLLVPIGPINIALGKLASAVKATGVSKVYSGLKRLIKGPKNSTSHIADAVFNTQRVPLQDKQKIIKTLKYAKSQRVARAVKHQSLPYNVDRRIPLDAETLSKYYRSLGKRDKVPDYIKNFPKGNYANDDLNIMIGWLSSQMRKAQ